MIRWLIKHNDEIRRGLLPASWLGAIINTVYSCFALKLHTQPDLKMAIEIVIIQVSTISISTFVSMLWFAYMDGKMDMLQERNRLLECQIQDIPGMSRPIFIRPDDPNEK